MNPVEIEQAISDLAESPYDAQEFPYAFLEAFGRKATEIKRLRTGDANKSDLGGVLQRNNIHIVVCPQGTVSATYAALKDSPATTKFKAKFILATDGEEFQAEDLTSGETVACAYTDFPNFFGTFLPLAGISTVKQIRESAFDIKATGRLNRLYVELLKDNPDWGTSERRHDLNHFMARLIFCFFAEDTDIFNGAGLFTATVDQMSNRDGTNVNEVISEIFRAMNVKSADRASADLPRWADVFPYVNGNMFSGSTEVPRFSKIAQRYLSHIGGLDWTKINPDIFGSMIQAVADEDERSVLGMHYTSVPNILKVLNPLFLDNLNAALEEAGDNGRKLLNLRTRISKIRVFDPACGSGNFLVISYKYLRAIEAEINRRRGESERKTDIPLTNFRGIEIRDFSAEIARLALIIAEYQCDVTYRGQKEALAEFLPLDSQNWITCGNALRLDWLSICPPTGIGVKFQSEDLFRAPLDQAQIDFENEGGETYICGNPPYKGSQQQSREQKEDLEAAFSNLPTSTKILDYVSGWFSKAADFLRYTSGCAAFVTTNSVNQGRQVEALWGPLFANGFVIPFAHTSFTWANLASHNAGVTVSIVAISMKHSGKSALFSEGIDDFELRMVDNINGYLVAAPNVEIAPSRSAFFSMPEMVFGNMPNDGGALLLDADAARQARMDVAASDFIRPFIGSQEFINGVEKFCIWVRPEEYEVSKASPLLAKRFAMVEEHRRQSNRSATNKLANVPFAFGEVRQKGDEDVLVVPRITSERREYLPVGLVRSGSIISSQNFAIYSPPSFALSLLASRLHRTWIAIVCGRTRTDFAYSNTLGWNTFPVPKLTEKNREDLTRCAEDILLAREAHFPATIADLYDPEKMPADLRAAHDRNDETLERIYIGRRFKNDTERLEKLFDMYTKMTTKVCV
ncbi:class I SAM-dependent DNA methyltransferase [Asaia lannensis]|uniref:site-specific DNA-methyltransferase (adenine-specific) n=1 Tax=Asaia lannensis NBRC 102526 TaxID=1307926 RepID=A0ABT1CGR4_9PROT|nr:DNA methyltransferase [Asaia lannensis]MCO6160052.1 lactate dehydrogenase [Asaia lannensis NBRC 102526]GBQ99414.1 DNA methylase [Asaia lannensis NBRC 102526]